MSEYVYAGTGLPAYDKTNARDILAGFSQSYIAASEWNSLVTCVTNLKSAILSGAWHGLGDGTGVAVSASGLMRIRQVGGVLQISYNGGAYADMALAADIPESSISTGLTGVTAYAGGGQVNATALTADVNFVTTCATDGDSVKLPTASLGKVVTVRNEGAKTLAVYPATGAAIAACGTNGAFFMEPYSSHIFIGQSSTAWEFGNRADGKIYVNDFGADPTGAADSLAAINAAIAAAASQQRVSNFGGYGCAEVVFGVGAYKTSDTITLTSTVTLRGQGSYGFNYSTVIRPAVDKCGIKTATGAHGCTIRDLALWGHATWPSYTGDAGAHGIWVNVTTHVENVLIEDFSGNAFHVYADVTDDPATNANGWTATRCNFQGGQNCVYTRGGDANAGTMIGCNIGGAVKWGIYEYSFLGNTYLGNEIASCGQGPIFCVGSNNASVFLGTYLEGDMDPSTIFKPAFYQHALDGAGTLGTGSSIGQDTRIKRVPALPPTSGTFSAGDILCTEGSGTQVWYVFGQGTEGTYSEGRTLTGYSEGRTLTGDGTTVAILDSASSVLAVGMSILVNGITYTIIAINGTSVTLGDTLAAGTHAIDGTDVGTLSAASSVLFAGMIIRANSTTYTILEVTGPTTLKLSGVLATGTHAITFSGCSYLNLTTNQTINYAGGWANNTMLWASSGGGDTTTGNVVFNKSAAPDSVAGWMRTSGAWTAMPRLAGGAGNSTGSPGNATLNTSKGRSAFAAGANSVTITNSLVTDDTIIAMPVLQTLDASLTQILAVICTTGSFTVYGNANATATTNFGWNIVE